MREYFITKESLAGLVRNLTDDIKTFIRQEIELVEKEMSEKVSTFGGHIAILGAGSFIASAGINLLLAGLGLLLAFAFERAGLDTTLAAFSGFALVGLLVITVGAAMSLKGAKKLTSTPLAPQKTLSTVKGGEIQKTSFSHSAEPSSDELHRAALATKQRIDHERRELTHRISPSQLTKHAVEHIRKHPATWSSVALAGVLTGGYFIGRKFWRA